MWLSEQGGIEPETAKRMDDVCCADLSTAAVGACDERTVAVGKSSLALRRWRSFAVSFIAQRASL
jgi:hypothetical protein